MIQPTLRQLTYLLALRETGSFSKAALACHVTQSTLSAGIRELEAILKSPVVDRAGRRVRFTPLGEKILDHAEKMQAHALAIATLARQADRPMSGVIRLGIIPTVAPYFLPRALPALQKKFPRLELQLYEDLTARLLESLHAGRVDIVLMAFPYDTPGLETRKLFDEEFYLACPREKAPEKKSIAPEDLKDMNLLLLEDGHCLRDHALSACRYIPPQRHKTFSATSLPTLIQMVRHGYGATLLPAMVANETAQAKNLILVPFRKPVPTRTIGLAWRAENPRTADLKTLAQALKA